MNKEKMTEENYQTQLKKIVESYKIVRATCNELNMNYEIQLQQLNLKQKELTQNWLNENGMHQEKMERNVNESCICNLRSVKLDHMN